MWQRSIFFMFMLLSLTLAMTACGKKASAARAALAKMNVPFTAASFVENAHQGKTDLVGMFLDAGMANQVEVVNLLITRRADVNTKNRYQGTALMNAVCKGQSETVRLLLDAGAEIDARDRDGMTALMYAAWFNQADLAKLLMERGADIKVKDQQGRTALARAEFKGNLEIARMLMAKGAARGGK